MICDVCGKEFVAKRKTAKYCSAGCRVKAARRISVTGTLKDSVTRPLSVTESVPVKVSVTPLEVVTDASQIEDTIQTMKDKKRIKDRDNFFSPDYDLSKEGFIRRNKNWLDDGTYPGTEVSRKLCMESVSIAHIATMKRQAQDVGVLRMMRLELEER